MELETDMDELLNMRRNGSWMARVKQLLVDLQTHRGLHFWPVEQDPQHSEAEHTLAQNKSRSLTLVNGGSYRTITACPQAHLISTTILRVPAARPGTMSGAPHAPNPGALLCPISFPSFVVVVVNCY